MKITTTGTIAALAVAVAGTLVLVLSRSAAVEAVYPATHVKQALSRRIASRVVGFFRGAEAMAENVRLRREVAALSMVRSDLDRMESENARLRRALEYRARNPEMWLAAGVLTSGGGAAGAHNVIRVDKGSLAGVRKGAVVTVPEGLVGQVTGVTPHTSEITLITDRSLKVACEVETDDRVRPQGILSGGSEESLLIRHLRHATGVPARSRVLTSGVGGIFPKGIEIGTLLDVLQDVRGLASEGEVQPSVEFSALEDVFIRREK